MVVALPEDMLVQETEAKPRGLIKPIQAEPSNAAIGRVMQYMSEAKRPDKYTLFTCA